MRSPRELLRDMVEAIENIERYTSRGRARFDDDELVQVWMIRHIHVLGEAANRLGQGFCQQHPELPVAQIVAMRNILVHEYFGIDLQAVWNVVESDLPALKLQIIAILRGLEDDT